MTGHGVHIHRWRNEYIVSRAHVAPERVRSQLDEIARHLPDELCGGLAPWLAGQPESVVLLNRVVLDCELDLSRDSWLLVARWAHYFARALIRSVDMEADGMMRFTSQAAFRAQFISDLAAGNAWHLWYYRSFHGLQALPVSSAIRTLLLDDKEVGRATLVEVSPQTWQRLASTITCADALRILDGLGGDDDTLDLGTVAALVKRRDGRMPTTTPWFSRALRFFADVLRAGGHPSRALASLSRMFGKLSAPFPDIPVESVAAAISRGDVADLVAMDPEHDAETWTAIAMHPEWRPLLADVNRERSEEHGACSQPGFLFTSFAGLALLVTEIDSLLTADVCHALPPLSVGQPRAVAAWLSLAHCAGGRFAHAVINESFWREFFGISPKVDLCSVMEWLEAADAEPALNSLARAAEPLARGQPVLTVLRSAGVRRRVVVDTPTQIWCRVENLQVVDSAPWQKRLSAARLARADWVYLASTMPLSESWRLFFIQIAQIALRRFAYRVPGFAGTSLPYLHGNFLAAHGRWCAAKGDLRLSRPPLYTLLQITGIARSAIRWSGPPARELRPEFEA
jgi:hypothetical protein